MFIYLVFNVGCAGWRRLRMLYNDENVQFWKASRMVEHSLESGMYTESAPGEGVVFNRPVKKTFSFDRNMKGMRKVEKYIMKIMCAFSQFSIGAHLCFSLSNWNIKFVVDSHFGLHFIRTNTEPCCSNCKSVYWKWLNSFSWKNSHNFPSLLKMFFFFFFPIATSYAET